jgi:hypothetical protein
MYFGDIILKDSFYPWDITLSEYEEIRTYFVQGRMAGLNTIGRTENAFRIHLNKTRN